MATPNGHIPPGDGPISDAELIHRFQTGDESSFEPLFERYAAVLHGWVARRLSRSLQRKLSVADVLQSTRIVAATRLVDFEEHERGSFKSWLFQIARHKVRDAIRNYTGTAKRAAVREFTRGDRVDTANFAARVPSPSQVAMASERRRRLRMVMAALPQDYCTVLQMARLEELPLREVALRMGRSREAVKKLYGRALSRFTELYREMEGTRDG